MGSPADCNVEIIEIIGEGEEDAEVVCLSYEDTIELLETAGIPPKSKLVMMIIDDPALIKSLTWLKEQVLAVMDGAMINQTLVQALNIELEQERDNSQRLYSENEHLLRQRFALCEELEGTRNSIREVTLQNQELSRALEAANREKAQLVQDNVEPGNKLAATMAKCRSLEQLVDKQEAKIVKLEQERDDSQPLWSENELLLHQRFVLCEELECTRNSINEVTLQNQELSRALEAANREKAQLVQDNVERGNKLAATTAITKKVVALCDKERREKVASLVALQHTSAPTLLAQPSTAISTTQVISAKTTAPPVDRATSIVESAVSLAVSAVAFTGQLLCDSIIATTSAVKAARSTIKATIGSILSPSRLAAMLSSGV